MPSTPAPTKTCVVCGDDVSNKQRFKDAKGQYACKPCHEGIQKNAAARALSNQPVVPPAMLALPEAGGLATQAAPAEHAGVSPCPACGAPRQAGAVVCMTCGFNSETGKALATKKGVMKEPKVKKRRMRVNLGSAIVPLIAGAILGLTLAASFASPDMFLLYVGALSLYCLYYSLSLIIFPFIDDCPGWGVCAILSHFIPFIGIAMLWYIFCVNERSSLKVGFLIYLLGIGGMVVAILGSGQTLFETGA